MKISNQSHGENVSVISIDGKLDISGSLHAQDFIVPLIIEDSKLVLDLSDCDWISSSGLRILLIIAKTAMSKNSQIIVVGVRKAVWDIMEMTGFSSMFTFDDNLDEAFKTLGVA